MFKYLTMLNVLFCSSAFAQTYECVNLVSPDHPYNKTYLHSPDVINNAGNPVCARLINYQESYSSVVYDDVKLEKKNASVSVL